MTQMPSAPSHRLGAKKHQPLNHFTNDFTTPSGVRVSSPIYIDVPNSQRKELLNAIRQRCYEGQNYSVPDTQSGISTVTAGGLQVKIEQYIGMTLDILRTVLFSRGGCEISLLLRLQEVAQIEIISLKEILQGMKTKSDLVKKYISDNKFDCDA